MATRVLILKATSDKMLDDIFRKKPTFKEIYPKIDADTIQIVAPSDEYARIEVVAIPTLESLITK